MDSFFAFKDTVLLSMASGISAWLLYELHRLRQSVQELNIRMAVVIEKHVAQEKTIEHLDERLKRLEDKAWEG